MARGIGVPDILDGQYVPCRACNALAVHLQDHHLVHLQVQPVDVNAVDADVLHPLLLDGQVVVFADGTNLVDGDSAPVQQYAVNCRAVGQVVAVAADGQQAAAGRGDKLLQLLPQAPEDQARCKGDASECHLRRGQQRTEPAIPGQQGAGDVVQEHGLRQRCAPGLVQRWPDRELFEDDVLRAVQRDSAHLEVIHVELRQCHALVVVPMNRVVG
mmetsp:Transcript_59108/g.158351  ORF Transcript_59108/g.158351 Transcript_59108/m.158351 type:complete len:214 (+) Transcript_59108:794-1435(+)